MPFIIYIPYIVVAVIWTFMLVLALIIYFCNKGDNLPKVYENCTEHTAEYQYIVRIVYTHQVKGYDIKNTTITVDIRDSSKRSLSKIAFTPQIMRNSVRDDYHKKVARFKLFRSKPIKDISFVDLNHNSPNGTIFISDFSIQEVNSENANIAFPGVALENLPKHRNEMKQQYPAGTTQKRSIHDNLGASATLTCVEFLVFLFLSVNIILLSCVLIIPCNSKKFCTDYSDGLGSSAFAGLVASLLAMLCFVVTIVIYRYPIKRRYAKGKKHCVWIRFIYIIGLILIGMICGILAAFIASKNNKFKQKSTSQPYDHEIYWTLACGIGIIIFVLVWIPIFAFIAYFCGFFGSLSLKETVGEQTPKKGSSGSAGATLRTKDEDESDNNKTAKRKSKSGPKSKPKSAAKSKSRLKVASSPNVPKSVKRLESPPQTQPRQQPVPRTESQESTGENYYQTIVQRHGKVKSVSQYPGIGR